MIRWGRCSWSAPWPISCIYSSPRERASRDSAQPLDYDGVCAALADKRNLSAREREILPYIARGHRPAYVADLLCISEHTVRTHLRNMYRKLGINSREELIQLVEETAGAHEA